MPTKRYPHSIRFSEEEWNHVTAAAGRNNMIPGEFVRAAATHAAARELDLTEARLTPELIELFKRTFRGVHLLAYLKREELADAGELDRFKHAVSAAHTAQSETLGSRNGNEQP